jgi:hypothetical protein
MERYLHRSVSRAAEDRTLADKSSCFLRSEVHFYSCVFLYLYVQIQFFEFHPVIYVVACDREDHGHTLLQRDLIRGISETLSDNLDALRCLLSVNAAGKDESREEHCDEERCYKPVFHDGYLW